MKCRMVGYSEWVPMGKYLCPKNAAKDFMRLGHVSLENNYMVEVYVSPNEKSNPTEESRIDLVEIKTFIDMEATLVRNNKEK